eukprot:TRINITY_DN293_c0_g1_i2.p2 TRINITY_DN293_c0_g1~~TRINITY_DN293_c0_g1_i2.p2  ORF type:complete len:215 (+),score=49.37 TRINITY_DN293_c0_g1_i2:19-663(+)
MAVEWLGLALAVAGLCCWGSWLVPMKLRDRARADVFFFDAVAGFALASAVACLALGVPIEHLHTEFAGFVGSRDGLTLLFWPFLSGVSLNLGNYLSAIGTEMAGLVIRQTISSGICMPAGTLLSWALQRVGRMPLLASGLAASLTACALSGVTNVMRNKQQKALRGSGEGDQSEPGPEDGHVRLEEKEEIEEEDAPQAEPPRCCGNPAPPQGQG